MTRTSDGRDVSVATSEALRASWHRVRRSPDVRPALLIEPVNLAGLAVTMAGSAREALRRLPATPCRCLADARAYLEAAAKNETTTTEGDLTNE